MSAGQVRGRINIDTENVGANEKLFNHGDTAGTAKSKKRKSFLSLLFAVPGAGQVRGRINIDTENVGANEKLFNHGDTAGTAKSKKRKSFLSLLFAVPAVSPWLTAFSIGGLYNVFFSAPSGWRPSCQGRGRILELSRNSIAK